MEPTQVSLTTSRWNLDVPKDYIIEADGRGVHDWFYRGGPKLYDHQEGGVGGESTTKSYQEGEERAKNEKTKRKPRTHQKHSLGSQRKRSP